VKRAAPRSSQFVRGFRLATLYAQGVVITTASIRKLLGVSRATAKRDMRAMASLVKVTPSKAMKRQREHFPRMAAQSVRDDIVESLKG